MADGRKMIEPRTNGSSVSSVAKVVSKIPHSINNGPTAYGYGAFFQEYSMMAEYALLQKQRIPGVYVLPSAKSSFVWNGLLFVRLGIYQDGVFKFTMTIPENYPDGEAPTFKFEFPVFHPMVNPDTGEIDVKRAFPIWRKNHHHLSAVLLYARRIFFKIETTMPLNPEAAALYDQDSELFQNRVAESVQQARKCVLQTPALSDPYNIICSSWNPSVHEPAKQQMLNTKFHFGSGVPR